MIFGINRSISANLPAENDMLFRNLLKKWQRHEQQITSTYQEDILYSKFTTFSHQKHRRHKHTPGLFLSPLGSQSHWLVVREQTPILRVFMRALWFLARTAAIEAVPVFFFRAPPRSPRILYFLPCRGNSRLSTPQIISCLFPVYMTGDVFGSAWRQRHGPQTLSAEVTCDTCFTKPSEE